MAYQLLNPLGPEPHLNPQAGRRVTGLVETEVQLPIVRHQSGFHHEWLPPAVPEDGVRLDGADLGGRYEVPPAQARAWSKAHDGI
ncbi:protein of unknown function [Azospirillum baldaniorum]|uniref:Uncharacterized protein n=1 Tax=Azospirillum baldaniorum TaxID=1064539 RepID=A0A9P1NLE3_9PROT|nr:protein of unknown function [Azospirillum baldaniorum]